MRRLIAGEAGAEEDLVRRYRDGVAIIISRIVYDPSVSEDLSQDTFRIVLEKIRQGEVREPERLSGFILGVARNLAIQHIRRMRRAADQVEFASAEQVQDPQPDPFEQLLNKERAEIVRQVITELKLERDREVLFRYYIAEQDREQICADLSLTSEQFSRVVFRAHQRFKELHLKKFGSV